MKNIDLIVLFVVLLCTGETPDGQGLSTPVLFAVAVAFVAYVAYRLPALKQSPVQGARRLTSGTR